jgi:Flp pilus assembly protein TadG
MQVRKLEKDDSGAAAVVMALLFPVLIGGMVRVRS